MKSTLLLPQSFRAVGWILSAISLLLGLTILYGGFEPQFMGSFSDEIASVGLIIGLMFLGFARQNIEDEMISSIRLESLQWALYINYGLLLISIFAFYDFDFLQVLLYNMFTTLLVFNIRFYWLLYRINSNQDKQL